MPASKGCDQQHKTQQAAHWYLGQYCVSLSLISEQGSDMISQRVHRCGEWQLYWTVRQLFWELDREGKRVSRNIMKFCTGKCAQEKVLCLGCSNPLQRHQLYLTVWQAEVVLIWPPRLCGLNATAGGVVRSWNSLLRASAQQATFCSRAHKERKQHSGS